MKNKVATYALLVICLASFLLDTAFVLQAVYQAQKLSILEATVNNIVIDKYRTTAKIPIIEVDSEENNKELLYQKFGSASLRWLFQSVPQERDKITYYKLDRIDKERGNYVVGIGVNQKCSSFKLWLDVYASYAYNTVLFMLNFIAVFAALVGLGKLWDFNLINSALNKILVIYSFLKLIFYALAIS